MKNKKIIKKVKLVAKNVRKQTKAFMKMADKETGKAIKVLKKEWERERPQREVYKKEFKKAADKAGKKGLELLDDGIKNGKKIGVDVAAVIKKDIEEIYNRNNKKSK